MGQKTNPQGFRLGISTKHKNNVFLTKNTKEFNNICYLVRQKIIKEYLEDILPNLEILESNISNTTIKISIISALPQVKYLNIKRYNKLNSELISNLIKQKLINLTKLFARIFKLDFQFMLIFNLNPWTNSEHIGFLLKKQLEKRMPFRKVLITGIQKARIAGAKGIKIELSGRLNGIDIARSEWLLSGILPLQTLDTPIQYTETFAKTIYGIIGIKIWLNN